MDSYVNGFDFSCANEYCPSIDNMNSEFSFLEELTSNTVEQMYDVKITPGSNERTKSEPQIGYNTKQKIPKRSRTRSESPEINKKKHKKKRVMVTKACYHCRKGHRKCEEKKPCSHCIKRNRECFEGNPNEAQKLRIQLEKEEKLKRRQKRLKKNNKSQNAFSRSNSCHSSPHFSPVSLNATEVYSNSLTESAFIYCSNCFAAISTSANFCETCGKKAEKPITRMEEAIEMLREISRQNKRLKLLLLQTQHKKVEK